MSLNGIKLVNMRRSELKAELDRLRGELSYYKAAHSDLLRRYEELVIACNNTNTSPCVESIFASAPEPLVTVQGTTDADVQAAITQINNAGGGTLYFPAGVYDIVWKSGGAIDIDDVNNLLICGDGPSSVIRLSDSQDNVFARSLVIADSSNIEIANLDFDGNRSGVTTFANEQQSNIFIRRASNIYVHDVNTREANGDGLNIGTVSNVLIQRFSADDHDRNGISIGVTTTNPGPTENVVICDSYFGPGIDTQQFDMEPEGGIGVRPINNISFFNNTFAEMLPEDSVNNDQRSITVSNATNVLIKDNVLDNPLLIRNAADVEVSQNTKVEQTAIDFDVERVLICGNDFEFQQPTTTGNTTQDNGIAIREVSNRFPVDITIDSNTFNGDVGSYVIYNQDGNPVRLTNNTFNVSGDSGWDVFMQAQEVDVDFLQSGNVSMGAIRKIPTNGFVVVEDNTNIAPCVPSSETKESKNPLQIECRDNFK